MHIVVPIKQVPETGNVKMDEKTGTIIREGVETIINPLDLYSIETAIQLKEQNGGKITVISMGPLSAEKAIREAIAMGIDGGILITGGEFAGSDTWVTSLTLSRAIEKTGPYDLIGTGERATDGETGQVGPEIASILDLPLATYTSRIIEINDGSIILERLLEEGYETLKLRLPALITVVKEISSPRLPTLFGKKRAKNIKINHWSHKDLDLNPDEIGLKGSPTRVVKIYKTPVLRKAKIVKADDTGKIEVAVRKIIDYMRKKNLL